MLRGKSYAMSAGEDFEKLMNSSVEISDTYATIRASWRQVSVGSVRATVVNETARADEFAPKEFEVGR